MKKVVSLLVLFAPLVVLASRMPATAANGITRPERGSDATLATFIEQQVRYQARTDPTFPPPGSVHILRVLTHGNGAAIIVAYPLRHSTSGCVGIGWMFALYKGQHWVAATQLQLGESCVSAKAPIDFRWAFVRLMRYSADIIYGRTLSTVHDIRIFQGARTLTVPIQHSSFLIMARCKGIQLVQALDARGHVAYAIKPLGCR